MCKCKFFDETEEQEFSQPKPYAQKSVAEVAAANERERIMQILDQEYDRAQKLASKEDCSDDCYKCDLISNAALAVIDRVSEAVLDGAKFSTKSSTTFSVTNIDRELFDSGARAERQRIIKMLEQND